MWRFISTHERGETEYLDAVMKRVEADEALRGRADASLRALADEPLFAELLACPQSPNHHAEGPFVEDHLRLGLMALHAVVEGKLHLIDIEEFRRMKGYEGEIDELEEIIKERAASLEVYLLCHDLGKPHAVWFEATPDSRGADLGFCQPKSHAWDADARTRFVLLQTYRERYAAFAAERGNEPSAVIQAEFFLAYQIFVHYPGHDHAVARPDLRAFVTRIASAHRLSADEAHDVYQVIVKHMDAVRGFQDSNARLYAHLVEYAKRHGRDADDFLDFFLAAVFLDAVCASRNGSAHGAWHDASTVVHFLRSEHDHAPWKRDERARERAEAEKRQERQRFKAAGLDGGSLLPLLDAKPGPAFGGMLAEIHAVARGAGVLPPMTDAASQEIEKRMVAFRKQVL
jgi:hypothetical protein